LNLDGQEFNFARGYVVKLEARQAVATTGRPHGVKYSLTLHDPQGRRIYGIDNAHRTGRRREFDHRHLQRRAQGRALRVSGPLALLEDFYREVERILHGRGVT
jgi:hypothetical protein